MSCPVDNLDNLALACKVCNFIKRDRNFADKDSALDRIEIVARAREFILDRRAENSRRLQRRYWQELWIVASRLAWLAVGLIPGTEVAAPTFHTTSG